MKSMVFLPVFYKNKNKYFFTSDRVSFFQKFFVCVSLALIISLIESGQIFEEYSLKSHKTAFASGQASDEDEPHSPEAQTQLQAMRFESYESAKIELIKLIQNARFRVILISSALTDGEISTSLHSAKIRQKYVHVLLDQSSLKRYNSRHKYLTTASIPVYFGNTNSMGLEAPTIIVVDNFAYRFSSPIDSSWKKEVHLSPSKYTAGELIAAISSKGNITKFKNLEVQGAKTPTRATKETRAKSGTISLKARASVKRPADLSKTLPKKTRFNEINAGSLLNEDPIKPFRGLQDGKLQLDNEAELLPD